MADISLFTTESVVIEVHATFSLSALCQASGAEPDSVRALVVEGLLQPTGQGPEDWRFSGEALPQARKALRLARDLDLDLHAVALVMGLLAEIDSLRSRLPRL